MKIECPACAGPVNILPDDRYLRCEHCDSTIHVELGESLRHTTFKLTVPEDHLRGLIVRELKEHELHEPVSIRSIRLTYIPFWRFKTDREILYRPAATLVEPFWDNYVPRSGELQYFDPTAIGHAQLIDPDIYLESALAKLSDPEIAGQADMEPSLVFIPFYRIETSYGRTAVAVYVSGHSGRIFFDNLPLAPAMMMNRNLAFTAGIVFFSYTLVTYLSIRYTGNFLMVLLTNLVLTAGLYRLLMKTVIRR
ncbi:hypothetical protein JXA40_02400 [bacterium]|nr:hypothetical protein [candidate division CSSED10-310 bacterium]